MNDAEKKYKNLCILNNDLHEKFCVIEDEEIVFFTANFSKPIKGNIYVGIVEEIREALMGIFVKYDGETRGFLSFQSIHPNCFNDPNSDIVDQIKRSFDHPEDEFQLKSNVSSLIKRGQKILVQITREPTSYKKAMLSTYISIGKKLTYIPNSIHSKVFFSSDLSIRYRKEVDNFLKVNEINGSFSIQKEVTINEICNEINNWKTIQERFNNHNDCGLIYESHDKMKTIFFRTEDIKECIHNKPLSLSLIEEIREYWPNIEFVHDNKIHIRLHDQINDIFHNMHQLKCGGFILWNLNHACTTIDVNLGHNKSGDHEQSVIVANFEAAQIIAQQIKLKNIGGLIVIDFLKMPDSQQQDMINDYMAILIKHDYAKVKMEKINSLGVMMLCRQHVNSGFNIYDIFKTHQNPDVAEYRLVDQLLDEIEVHTGGKLNISVSKAIYNYILKNQSKILEKIMIKGDLSVNRPYGFSISEI